MTPFALWIAFSMMVLPPPS